MKNRFLISIFFLSVILSSCNRNAGSGSGQHATVLMRDGTSVSGTAISTSGNEIQLAGDDKVTRTIPMAQVRSIEYDDTLPRVAGNPPPPAGAPPAASMQGPSPDRTAPLVLLTSIGPPRGKMSCMSRMLIIGATGRVGRHVASQLPTTGLQVRALARNPHADGLPPHVDVVQGDLSLPETLDECLDGIDAVFLVWTAPPATVAPALERMAKHARRIVFLSSPYKTARPFFQGGQPNPLRALHEGIERLIERSGLQWTFLRPGAFAANALWWWAPQIRAGGDLVRWPYLAAPTAPIDERDIATVAVRALCEDGHAGAEYALTGPQSLTQFEQISTISDVIGRPLRVEEISPDKVRQELLALLPAFVVNMLLDAWAAAIGQPAFVTSTTGRPITPLNFGHDLTFGISIKRTAVPAW